MLEFQLRTAGLGPAVLPECVVQGETSSIGSALAPNYGITVEDQLKNVVFAAHAAGQQPGGVSIHNPAKRITCRRLCANALIEE